MKLVKQISDTERLIIKHFAPGIEDSVFSLEVKKWYGWKSIASFFTSCVDDDATVDYVIALLRAWIDKKQHRKDKSLGNIFLKHNGIN